MKHELDKAILVDGLTKQFSSITASRMLIDLLTPDAADISGGKFDNKWKQHEE
jgi:hypothetical protein